MLTLTVSGLEEAADELEQAPAALDRGVQAAVRAAAEQEQGILQRNTPVRTREAQRGWIVSDIDGGSSLTNDVNHIDFLLHGTGRKRDVVINTAWPGMYPNAALRAAWMTAEGDIEQDLQDRLQRLATSTLSAA